MLADLEIISDLVMSIVVPTENSERSNFTTPISLMVRHHLVGEHSPLPERDVRALVDRLKDCAGALCKVGSGRKLLADQSLMQGIPAAPYQANQFYVEMMTAVSLGLYFLGVPIGEPWDLVLTWADEEGGGLPNGICVAKAIGDIVRSSRKWHPTLPGETDANKRAKRRASTDLIVHSFFTNDFVSRPDSVGAAGSRSRRIRGSRNIRRSAARRRMDPPKATSRMSVLCSYPRSIGWGAVTKCCTQSRLSDLLCDATGHSEGRNPAVLREGKIARGLLGRNVRVLAGKDLPGQVARRRQSAGAMPLRDRPDQASGVLHQSRCGTPDIRRDRSRHRKPGVAAAGELHARRTPGALPQRVLSFKSKDDEATLRNLLNGGRNKGLFRHIFHDTKDDHPELAHGKDAGNDAAKDAVVAK
jgi:hypothetical protein